MKKFNQKLTFTTILLLSSAFFTNQVYASSDTVSNTLDQASSSQLLASLTEKFGKETMEKVSTLAKTLKTNASDQKIIISVLLGALTSGIVLHAGSFPKIKNILKKKVSEAFAWSKKVTAAAPQAALYAIDTMEDFVKYMALETLRAALFVTVGIIVTAQVLLENPILLGVALFIVTSKMQS